MSARRLAGIGIWRAETREVRVTRSNDSFQQVDDMAVEVSSS